MTRDTMRLLRRKGQREAMLTRRSIRQGTRRPSSREHCLNTATIPCQGSCFAKSASAWGGALECQYDVYADRVQAQQEEDDTI